MTDYKGPNAFSNGVFKPAKAPTIIPPYQRSPGGVVRKADGPAFDNRFPKSRYRGGGQSGLRPVLEIPDTPVVPPYVAKAVHFAGTPVPTYLQSNNLTVDDSPLGLFSLWMNLLDASGETGLYQTVNGRFWFITVKNNGGTLHIAAEFWDTTNSFVFTFSIDTAFPAEPWLGIQITVDTNHPAGQKTGQIVINKTYYPVTVTRDTAGPYSIGWSQDADNTVFGNQPDNTDGNDFDISECYGAMGQFLDISIANNVAKFVDDNNKPVSLGSDGATPTGVAPTIYFSGDADTFATNLGTGGAFTLAGPLTNAATSPSDA